MAPILSKKTKNLLVFGYVSYLVFWTLLLIGQIWALFLSQNLSLDKQASGYGFTDFVHFYTAGKLTLSADRSLFYSWETQKALVEKITQCKVEGEDFYTQYVPPVFLLMAPYALLPINLAHLLFEIVNLAFGLSGIRMLLGQLDLNKNKMAYFVVLGALSSMPSWNTWYLGQISWLYLGFVSIYLLFLGKQKSDIWGGLALALCAIKPHYAIFLSIVALAQKRLWLLVFALTWDIFLLAICTAVFGLKAMLAYPVALSRCEVSFLSIHMKAMYGISSISSYFLSRAQTHHCGLILMFAAIFGLIIFLRLAYKKNAAINFNWLVTVLVLAALIFSPHSHSHDCILLTIPALLTLPYFSDKVNLPLSLQIWRWIFYLMPIFSWVIHWLICFSLPANFLLTGVMSILFMISMQELWTGNNLLNKEALLANAEQRG